MLGKAVVGMRQQILKAETARARSFNRPPTKQPSVRFDDNEAPAGKILRFDLARFSDATTTPPASSSQVRFPSLLGVLPTRSSWLEADPAFTRPCNSPRPISSIVSLRAMPWCVAARRSRPTRRRDQPLPCRYERSPTPCRNSVGADGPSGAWSEFLLCH
jgi:hypothetical protein